MEDKGKAEGNTLSQEKVECKKEEKAEDKKEGEAEDNSSTLVEDGLSAKEKKTLGREEGIKTLTKKLVKEAEERNKPAEEGKAWHELTKKTAFTEEMQGMAAGWNKPEQTPETEQDKIYKTYRKDLQWGRPW